MQISRRSFLRLGVAGAGVLFAARIGSTRPRIRSRRNETAPPWTDRARSVVRAVAPVLLAGAPQTIYSDHFLDTLPLDGPIGYKLEVPPLHPMLVATTLPTDGLAHSQWMSRLPHMQVIIALMRDGFHASSQGGTVMLQGDGTPLLDYPLDAYFWDGARRALSSMAEIQFAAGATAVMPLHANGQHFSTWPGGRASIQTMSLKGSRHHRGERTCDGRLRHRAGP